MASVQRPDTLHNNAPTWRELRLRAALERTEALLVRSVEERAKLAARVRELEASNGR